MISPVCAVTRPHRKPQTWLNHIGCVNAKWVGKLALASALIRNEEEELAFLKNMKEKTTTALNK